MNARQIQMREHKRVSLVFIRIKSSKYYTSMFPENKFLAGNRAVNSRRKKCVHQEMFPKETAGMSLREV